MLVALTTVTVAAYPPRLAIVTAVAPAANTLPEYVFPFEALVRLTALRVVLVGVHKLLSWMAREHCDPGKLV